MQWQTMHGQDYHNPMPVQLVLKKGQKLKIPSYLKNGVVTFFFNLQCCTIEMQHLLYKPYVNEVTLNGQNLYFKYYQTSELKLCIFRRLRSFQRGTVSLCRSTGFKITSCESWRMILLSGIQILAALVGLNQGQGLNFLSNLQL